MSDDLGGEARVTADKPPTGTSFADRFSDLAAQHRPLYTARYGLLVELQPHHEPWAARHKHARADANARSIDWCRCPGTGSDTTVCAQKITQEDGLCDQCRDWCVAVDHAGTYHLIADLAERAS